MWKPRKLFRSGFTLVEMLVVTTILLIAMGLITPVIVEARSAARRMTCLNNTKQIGIAMHNYLLTHNTLPPGWISVHSMPVKSFSFGWASMILPFVEQSRLYRHMNFQRPMPTANDLLQMKVDVYRCPSDPTPDVNSLRSNYGTSNYSGSAGTGVGLRGEGSPLTHWLSPRRTQFWPGETPIRRHTNGVFWLSSDIRFRHITDGTSNTLMVGERSAKSGAGIWAGVGRNDFFYDVVTDCGPGNGINKRFTSFSSSHKGGANFVMCDGRAKFISETIDPKVLQKQATRDGDEF